MKKNNDVYGFTEQEEKYLKPKKDSFNPWEDFWTGVLMVAFLGVWTFMIVVISK